MDFVGLGIDQHNLFEGLLGASMIGAMGFLCGNLLKKKSTENTSWLEDFYQKSWCPNANLHPIIFTLKYYFYFKLRDLFWYIQRKIKYNGILDSRFD